MANVFVLREASILKGDSERAHFFKRHTTLRLFEGSSGIVEKRYLMTFQKSSEAFGSSSSVFESTLVIFRNHFALDEHK